jgi:hypothetical protein
MKEYDVLIMADGNYRFLSDKNSTEQLKQWVMGGGRLIALENSVAQLAAGDWGIKRKTDDDDKKDDKDDKDDKKGDKKQDYTLLRKYENRERDYIVNINPGSIFKVELDNTHPLAFGYPDFYYSLKQDNNIYEFIKDDGWNVGVIKKEGQTAGFVGSKLKNKLKDGLLFGVLDMGRGNVVYMADDPMFRSFWENGKLLFCNAVFFVGQ